MTTYQYLNQTDVLTHLVRLMKNGHFDTSLITNLSIYDKFYLLTGTKTERYKKVGEEFNLHHKTIQKIIIKLNKQFK